MLASSRNRARAAELAFRSQLASGKAGCRHEGWLHLANPDFCAISDPMIDDLDVPMKLVLTRMADDRPGHVRGAECQSGKAGDNGANVDFRTCRLADHRRGGSALFIWQQSEVFE